MPGQAASLRITDAYRERLVMLRGRVLSGVSSAWALVSAESLDETAARAIPFARDVVAAGAAQAAALSGAYLGAFATSELRRTITVPPPPAPEPSGGDIGSAVIAAKVAAGYRRPDREILAAGLTRARAIAAWQVAESARTALADAMTESDVVVGWRRATSGAPCGACLAAATGAILDTEDVPEAHTNCQCVAEPVIRGVRDLHPRPTGEEIFDSLTAEQQDALFAGRGGAEKAHLIRSGTPLSALITRSTMAAQADQITETPLAALR